VLTQTNTKEAAIRASGGQKAPAWPSAAGWLLAVSAIVDGCAVAERGSCGGRSVDSLLDYQTKRTHWLQLDPYPTVLLYCIAFCRTNEPEPSWSSAVLISSPSKIRENDLFARY